jgi:hypothetical protein
LVPAAKVEDNTMVRLRGALYGARTRLLLVGQFVVVSFSVFLFNVEEGDEAKRDPVKIA